MSKLVDAVREIEHHFDALPDVYCDSDTDDEVMYSIKRDCTKRLESVQLAVDYRCYNIAHSMKSYIEARLERRNHREVNRARVLQSVADTYKVDPELLELSTFPLRVRRRYHDDDLLTQYFYEVVSESEHGVMARWLRKRAPSVYHRIG